MKRRMLTLWISALVLLIFGGTALAIVKTNEGRQPKDSVYKEMEEKMQDKLLRAGLQPVKIWTEEDILHISLKVSSKDKLGAQDILTLRTARNQVRLMAAEENDLIKSKLAVNNILLGPDENVLYDVTVYDFLTVSEDFTDSIRLLGETPKLSAEQTEELIYGEVKDPALLFKITEVSMNPLGGYFVDLQVASKDSRRDIEAINQFVQEMVACVDKLNQEGCSIGEYRISIADSEGDGLLFLMDVDCIYRDYLWWQEPSLGAGTWTGSSPRMPE